MVISKDRTISDIDLTVRVKNYGSAPAYDVQLWLEADNVRVFVNEVDVILQGEEREVGKIDKRLLDPILQRSGAVPKDIKIALYYYDPIEVKTVHMEMRLLLLQNLVIAPPEKPPGVLLNIPLLARDIYEVVKKIFRRECVSTKFKI